MIQIDLEIPNCCDECKFVYDSCCCIITGSRIDWDKFDSERLLDCPLNQIAEPKTGHWSRKTKVDAYDIAGVKTWGIKCQCDRCDFTTIVVEDFGYYKFCPNCGAKMVEPQESEVQE